MPNTCFLNQKRDNEKCTYFIGRISLSLIGYVKCGVICAYSLLEFLRTL